MIQLCCIFPSVYSHKNAFLFWCADDTFPGLTGLLRICFYVISMGFFEVRRIKRLEPEMLSQEFRMEQYIFYVVLCAMIRSKRDSKFSALKNHVTYLTIFSIGFRIISIFYG